MLWTSYGSRLLLAILTLSVILRPSVAFGEAGWSEIAGAESLWIRRPFALVKCGDKGIGLDSVDLVVARDATFDDWLSYDGIIVESHLVRGIDQFAILDNTIFMRMENDHRVASLELDHPDAVPRYYNAMSSLPMHVRDNFEASATSFERTRLARTLGRCVPFLLIIGAAIAIPRMTRGTPVEALPTRGWKFSLWQILLSVTLVVLACIALSTSASLPSIVLASVLVGESIGLLYHSRRGATMGAVAGAMASPFVLAIYIAWVFRRGL